MGAANISGPVSRETYVKALIRRRYGHQATAGGLAPGGAERARAAGYPGPWLTTLPGGLTAAYSGCGFALAEADLSGVRVAADLGCGAGLDACYLAHRLGREALVLAIDLTPAMLSHLRTATSSGWAAIAPIAGDMEALPLPGACADLVSANAAFNLALDKDRAFAEAARILKPGGRLVACELVLDGDLPAELAADPMGWNTSLGGVVGEDELRAAATGAGFEAVRISHHTPFPPVTAVRLTAVRGAR